MITSIEIANEASYGSRPEKMDALSKINFLFGPNGAGKSTIAGIIESQDQCTGCTVTWQGGTRLKRFIYDRDFVTRHFDESPELPGVFTLGEDQGTIRRKITKKGKEVTGLTERIQGLRKTLHGEDGEGGKQGDLEDLEDRIRKRCWSRKQGHDEHFAVVFDGYHGSKEKFKTKLLEERDSNSATVLSLDDLVERASTVFETSPETLPTLPPIGATALVELEASPILEKRIVGKSDIDIAAMIERLENSDWVRQGVPFYEANDQVCPFCQRSTSEEFAAQLAEYFDETFKRDSEAIKNLGRDYRREAEQVQERVRKLLSDPSEYLDMEKLRSTSELLDSRIAANLQHIETKQHEPSRRISLESVSNVTGQIQGLIDAANAKIEKHNTVVANLSEEKRTLTAQVWKYLVEVELKETLEDYDRERGNLIQAIESLQQQIREAKAEKERTEAEIRELEQQTTSLKPTRDAINALLSSFGFTGFHLDMADSGEGYRLVRPDGSDARETLSEGEKAFLTFLYFYHLLRGSDSEEGVTTNRVAVFDDPVTSMDSNVLFVVASLIRNLFSEVRDDSNSVKQVFVFTHNVYFHKEVTYCGPGQDRGHDETFWTVRKRDGQSRLKGHPSNPVKTSYEWLWAEVRDPDNSTQAIRNTMRRILENYFQILGEVPLQDIYAKFEGEDKAVCRSLISWVHAGSHHAFDDLFVAYDAGIEEYRRVFKAIFEKTNHEAHYNMMMRVDDDGEGNGES